MKVVTVLETEKVGKIEKINEQSYYVPDMIICPDDGEIMNYDSYHMAYICSKCDKVISGADFVKSELAKSKNKGMER